MLRYAITDRRRSNAAEISQEDDLLRQAARWAEAGIDYIQLREKDLEACALVSLARRLLIILRAKVNGPRLLINSRADVAVAVGADGVHLTDAPGSLTPSDIRHLYAAAGLREPIISISCHMLDDVASACAAGATLILFGPVFEKVVSNEAGGVVTDALIAEGTGVELLRLACSAAVPTRVLALGGATVENTAEALAAGAAGIASIRLFAA